VKRLAFLSFGHWQAAPGSRVVTAADALKQSVELAVAAEAIGLDGAFVRVHHFARQLSAPFPLLAAMAARTSRIELGTGVIDMRYENPLYMAEEAAVADLLSDGRLQLGVSRGSPEPAWRGAEAFGYEAADDGALAREKTARFRAAIAGEAVARADVGGRPGGASLAIQPRSPGLEQRIWWGSSTRETAAWAGRVGMNLMSSTLLLEDNGMPFDQLQADQIAAFHDAWLAAGWEHTPRVSVSRTVIPLLSDEDRILFRGSTGEQIGPLDGAMARFGRTYVDTPERIIEDIKNDAAVAAADTLLLTVPNQLGVEYNTRLLKTVVDVIAPALGWR
jgi:alkanesulfonate monooxygenase SsuD/methylene tetrahydromethanopterin reductase-like flavin-dependent oxidoreductase (luciferase family)